MSQGTIVRRGRPRKSSEEVIDKVATAEEIIEEIKPTIEKKKNLRVDGIRAGKEDVIAFHGVEHLVQGQSQFFVNGNPTTGYKVIRVYLDKKGKVKRALERMLKPRKRTERGERDRQIILKLKSLGIAGLL